MPNIAHGKDLDWLRGILRKRFTIFWRRAVARAQAQTARR
jgi:hypothetical protein